MSKLSSKPTKKEDIHQNFQITKKIVHQNNQYEIKLSSKTLDSHFEKRKDGLVLNFEGSWRNSDQTLKELAKAIRPLKRIRKLRIQCEG